MAVPSPLRLAAGVDPLAHARAWVASDALAELVTAFGGRPPSPDADLERILAELDAFSERWDLRSGRERNEVVANEAVRAPAELVEAATRELGQQDLAPPARREWDDVIVLGGLVRACVTRPAVTAQLLGSGAMTTSCVTGLGAFRRLNEPEVELARSAYAQDGDLLPAHLVPVDELDAMHLGIRRAFGADGAFSVRGEQHAEPAQSWEVREGTTASGTALRVVAAAADAPDRRATTPQALAWYARTFGVTKGRRLLVVTTEIYRHYHLVDAVRVLGGPFGAEVDAVGMSPAQVNPALDLPFTPSSRLQEVRSSIRALRALVAGLR